MKNWVEHKIILRANTEKKNLDKNNFLLFESEWQDKCIRVKMGLLKRFKRRQATENEPDESHQHHHHHKHDKKHKKDEQEEPIPLR